MQRDLDLVRDILLEVEAREDANGAKTVTIEGTDRKLVEYHVGLMIEADLLKGYGSRNKLSAPHYRVEKMTWDGHEFLDAARTETVWSRFKAAASEHGGALPFQVAKVLVLKLSQEVVLGNLGS